MTVWPNSSAAALRPFVGGLRQLASVRAIKLDDGPERGLAALAFSTGGGLDFWVLADRAMDIGPLWLRGQPLAWQSPAGFVHPAYVNIVDHEGRGFERAFSGFLHSCGLDHTRQPIAGHPLHGRLPFTPARIIGAGEDWERPQPVLWCEGEITQWRLGAESLRLIRRIEAPIGGRELVIRDRVENEAPTPQRTALLYHLNLGFPAIAPGTIVTLDGETVFGPIGEPDAAGRPIVTGANAKAARGVCRVVTPGVAHAPAMRIEFASATLPHLQVWHDPRPGAYVLAVEPCTAPRAAPGERADEPVLAPGARLDLDLRIAFDDVA